MRNSARLQMIAVLAISGILGYAAASAKLDMFSTGNAAPPTTPVADKAAESTFRSDGLTKGQLVAMADPKDQAAVAKAEGQNGENHAQGFIKAEPTPSRANGRRSARRMGGTIRHPT